MGKYLLIAGVLLNSVLLLINRFSKNFPDWLRFPLLLIAIGMIIIGASLTRR
jgi:hypothetical protein